MTTNLKSYPPKTIIIANNIRLSRDNFGVHLNGWPYTWSGAGTTYDFSPTYVGNTFPQGTFAFYGTQDAFNSFGWARHFRPSLNNIYDPSGATLSPNCMKAILKTLDHWYLYGVKVMWQWSYCANSTPLVNCWGDTLTTSTAEQHLFDFCTALFTSGYRSDLGYSMANHPALGAIELVNESSAVAATSLAIHARIAYLLINKYRTIPTLFFGQQLEGNNKGTPVRDYVFASAAGNVAVDGDLGTGKVLLNYIDGWSQHYYQTANTRAVALAKNNNIYFNQQDSRYMATHQHTLVPYWYAPSGIANNKWHNSGTDYYPRLWNTESDILTDISGTNPESSDGFRWGQLPPKTRYNMFLGFTLSRLFSTHDGQGNPGTTFSYILDSTNEDNLTNISSVGVGTQNRARITFTTTPPTYGFGANDNIVIKTTTNAWPELGIPENSYKRFVGQRVGTTGSSFDLYDTDITSITQPSGVTAYTNRYAYPDPDTVKKVYNYLTSGNLTFGYVIHPKNIATDLPSLGLMVHVEGQNPLYTDRFGQWQVW